MVLHEFFCKNCGSFEQIHNLKNNNEDIACPTCGGEAKRIFASPTYSGVFSGTRHMLQRRNEKGVEPRVVRRAPVEESSPLGKPQNHSHVHNAQANRPWMIKH